MLGMALAAMALAATPAAAQFAPFDPNPDFPGDDFNPENWVSIENTRNYNTEELCGEAECPIDNGEFVWHWYGENFGSPVLNTPCIGTLEGHVNADGEVVVTDAELAWHSNGYGADFCEGYEFDDFPWVGEICGGGPGGDWVRLPMTFGPYVGSSFARLDWDMISFETTTFNHGYSTLNGNPFQVRTHQADAPLGQPLLYDVDSENCGWPELQA